MAENQLFTLVIACIYIIGSIGSAIAPNFVTLLLFRFVWGLVLQEQGS